MKDLTRAGVLNQKKGICVFAGELAEGVEDWDLDIVSNDYLLGNLPEDALITNAYIHVKTASDAATTASAKLGTIPTGSQILSSANLKTAGKQGTFGGQSLTTTGKPLYLGVAISGAATAVGEYVVVVEYIEYTKNTGEYTRFS